MCFFITFCFSCSIKKGAIAKEDNTLIPFSTDSLDNINFFDFHGKTLEELLENNIINQYSGAGSVTFPRFFGYLQLYYFKGLESYDHRDLNIYFTRLQYTNEDTLNSNDDYIPLNQLLKEKIRHIQFADRYPVVKSQEEEQKLLYKLKNLDTSKYQGKPLDSLLKFPFLSKWSSITFENNKVDNKNCLESIWFHYTLNEAPNIILIIHLSSFNYSDQCIGILNRHWNLNDLRKEAIKDVEIVF